MPPGERRTGDPVGPVKDVKEEGRAREIDREIVRKHCGFEVTFAAFAAFHGKKKKVGETHPDCPL